MKLSKELFLKGKKYIIVIPGALLFFASCKPSRDVAFNQRKYYHFNNKQSEVALRQPSDQTVEKPIADEIAETESVPESNVQADIEPPAVELTAKNKSSNIKEVPAQTYRVTKKVKFSKPIREEIIEQAMSKYKIENKKIEDKPIAFRDHPYAVGSFIAAIVTFFTHTIYVTRYAYHYNSFGNYVSSSYFFTTWGFALAALSITFGIIALRRIKREPDKYTGKWMAWTAIGLGVMKLILSMLFAVLW